MELSDSDGAHPVLVIAYDDTVRDVLVKSPRSASQNVAQAATLVRSKSPAGACWWT